jgi:ribosome maturation factor RimP
MEFEREIDDYLRMRGLELVDLLVTGSPGGRLFRVYIDRIDGSPITIDDCADVAPRLKLFLESLDAFPFGSTLEVSSPGMDRILKKTRDFERFIGHKVRVCLRSSGKQETFEGVLSGAGDDAIVVSPVPSPPPAPKGKRRNGEPPDAPLALPGRAVPRNEIVFVRLVAEVD